MSARPAAVLRQVRAYARLAPSRWTGNLLVLADGDVLCPACAREEYRAISADTWAGYKGWGWGVAEVGPWWEGPPESCSNCNNWMISHYGDPDDIEDEDVARPEVAGPEWADDRRLALAPAPDMPAEVRRQVARYALRCAIRGG